MSEIKLEIQNLTKSFGGLIATDNLSLNVHQNEIHAVIGPNGAGKTTLIHQLSGMLRPDSGSIKFEGVDITALSASSRCHSGIVRSFQITSNLKEFTALDNVAMAVQARQGHSFRFWKKAKGDQDLTKPSCDILRDVGLGDRVNILAGNLAHGEQRRLEIAVALATSPKLLLLDEPMAGMDTDSAEQMIKYLSSLKGQYTILLIEHDMDAVFALADRITVLVYGKVIASGLPDEIRNNKDVRIAYLGTD